MIFKPHIDSWTLSISKTLILTLTCVLCPHVYGAPLPAVFGGIAFDRFTRSSLRSEQLTSRGAAVVGMLWALGFIGLSVVMSERFWVIDGLSAKSLLMVVTQLCLLVWAVALVLYSAIGLCDALSLRLANLSLGNHSGKSICTTSPSFAGPPSISRRLGDDSWI